MDEMTPISRRGPFSRSLILRQVHEPAAAVSSKASFLSLHETPELTNIEREEAYVQLLAWFLWAELR